MVSISLSAGRAKAATTALRREAINAYRYIRAVVLR